MPEITILGAGVTGLCVASELVSRGLRIRLIDKNGAPGPHGCSWWAGGMLAPFCEGETAGETVTRLGREAAVWWARHDVPVTGNGTLVVTPGRDRSELDRFARRTSNHRRLGGAQIAAVEPDLHDRFPEALFFAEEAHLNPRAALGILARNLTTRGIPVEPGDEAPQNGIVIDCRGFSARDTLPGLRGVRGEMAILRCPDITLSRPVRLLHPRHPLYIVPRGDGVFMLGATQIETGERRNVTARSLLELLSSAYALHPAFGEAEVLETGSDIRPAFPDNLPRIRREGRTIHVNGLFRHGFLLAPAMARMLADWMTKDRKPEMLDDN